MTKDFQKDFDSTRAAWEWIFSLKTLFDQQGVYPEITLSDQKVTVVAQPKIHKLLTNWPNEQAWQLHCDGASRGNPGLAATGYVLSGPKTVKGGQFLGQATNNQAEYQSLIDGLNKALELGVVRLKAHMDSQLVVRQVNGGYKVKSVPLKPLYAKVLELKAKLEVFELIYVPRALNTQADRAANKVLDAKIKEPDN